MPRLLDRRRRTKRITLAADKGYDITTFVKELRARRVTPHIAADRRVSKLGVARHSEIGARTTRHSGYAVSQRIRKRIEEVFGWAKSAAVQRQTRFRGLERVDSKMQTGQFATSSPRNVKSHSARTDSSAD